MTYLVGYAALRLVTEMFRGDRPERLSVAGLSIAQFLSVLIALLGVGLMGVLVMRGRRRATAS